MQEQPAAPAARATFGYKFENARFHIPLIEVDVDEEGAGEVRFKRGESDEVITLKLKLSPATLSHIQRLYGETGFLTSGEEYQSGKDFSHLGWKTLTARQGERERAARFNHTANKLIGELAGIFHGIATKEMHLFDIDTAQQYQPLDLPRQLEMLESDLRLERVAEPEQLLPPLREIASNDTVPLIARNHANRIIKDIEKNKYRSPVKK